LARIEHSTVQIDGSFQSFDVHVRSGAVNDDGSDDLLEARTRCPVDAEEAAQILQPVRST
jgi:hypothetical protein